MPRNTGPSAGTRNAVADRSSGRCERCARLRASEVHHRLGRRMGGTRSADIHKLANLMHLCSQCHRWITENPKSAYASGWCVRSHLDPAEVAVFYRGQWVFLTDDGSVIPVAEWEAVDA